MRACVQQLAPIRTPDDSAAAAGDFESCVLGAGIYAITWRSPLDAPIAANAVVIVGEDGVVVVDSPHREDCARSVIAEIRALTAAPVRYLINTRCHQDPARGNAEYRAAWPELTLIGSPYRQDNLVQLADQGASDGVTLNGNRLRTLERWLTRGMDDAGQPLDDERRERVASALSAFREFTSSMKDDGASVPDVAITSSLSIRHGRHTIEVCNLDEGRVGGDLLVMLPDRRIVITGDLVVHPVPLVYGPAIGAWAEKLEYLLSLRFDTIVPGHGRVLTGSEYVGTIASLLRALESEIEQAVEARMSLDEARRRVTLGEWKGRLTRSGAESSSKFTRLFLEPAVDRAWEESMRRRASLGAPLRESSSVGQEPAGR